MADELFPDVETEAREPGVTSSPLDTAAARGDLHWPSDPDLDPEGIPEPLHERASNVGPTMTGFVGSRGFPPN